MDKLMIPFPSNPLDSHKPDVDYQEEYQAAVINDRNPWI